MLNAMTTKRAVSHRVEVVFVVDDAANVSESVLLPNMSMNPRCSIVTVPIAAS